MKADLNIASHVVLDDKVFYSETPVRRINSQLGGPAAYASMVIPLLPIKAQCITSIGDDFPEGYMLYLSSMKNYNLEILKSPKTTRFLHEIHRNHRVLYLLEQAQLLDQSLIYHEGGRACLLSPVFKEISKISIDWAKENHEIVALDVQGFMRAKDDTNKIISKYDNRIFNELISSVDFVKFSLTEAMSFTNQSSSVKILENLPKNNIQIVTMGVKGIIYSEQEKYYQIETQVRKERDPTGAGDVLIASFIAKYLETSELDYSLAFSMAMAAEKVEFGEIQQLPDINYEKTAEQILETKKRID